MRYYIGTMQNHVAIDIDSNGIWMFIHNSDKCLGWYRSKNHKDLQITKEGTELKINFGDLTFWVKAKWLI